MLRVGDYSVLFFYISFCMCYSICIFSICEGFYYLLFIYCIFVSIAVLSHTLHDIGLYLFLNGFII